MQKSVVIDYLPECVCRYRSEWAIVAVDVIRATTTAITAAATAGVAFQHRPLKRRWHSLRNSMTLSWPVNPGGKCRLPSKWKQPCSTLEPYRYTSASGPGLLLWHKGNSRSGFVCSHLPEVFSKLLRAGGLLGHASRSRGNHRRGKPG